MSAFSHEELLPFAGRLGIFPVYASGDFAKVPAGTALFPDLKGEERGKAVGDLVVELRDRATTAEEIERWWGGDREYGVALNCGDFQCIDFDDPTIIAAWRDVLKDHALEGLLEKTARAATMSGGFHVWAYVPGCREKSHKLARHAAPVFDEKRGKEVLARIESRGYEGYALIAPSPGYRWIGGAHPLTLPEMTLEEFEALIIAATQLDEGPPEAKPESRAPRPKLGDGEESPNDWYERTASWDDILAGDAGGAFIRAIGHRLQYRRPENGRRGKRPSITTGNGRAGQDLAHVWTPNWPPFTQGETMSKYYAYAKWHHGGDLKQATKAIAAMPGFPKPQRQKKAGPAPVALKERDSENLSEHPTPLELPRIQHNARQLPLVTGQAIDALVASNDPAHLFNRGGVVVRVVEDKDDRHRIEALNLASMRNEIANAAFWYRQTDKGEVESYPPKDVAENLLAEQGIARRFPRLDGISFVPVMGPEGGFRRIQGYDAASKWFITGTGPYETYPGSGAQAAQWLLDEVFHDFPFEDDGGASKANTLSLALLPYVRPIIDGPTPMHYVEAPQSRTGKSLLIEVALSPSLEWSATASQAFPEKEEELNKLLATSLKEGDQLLFLDNVKGKVSSPSLEQLLTANSHRFRLLGSTASVTVPVRAIFAMTTNNGTLSIDMAGRSVLIRIDAKMERPEDRGQFKHPNIRTFLRENRLKVVAALMAMVEEWDRAGRPRASKRKASYVDWAEIMGGILEICEVPGFLDNDRKLKGVTADEEEPWRAFYQVWRETHQDRVVNQTVLFELSQKHDMLGELYVREGANKGMIFGRAMVKREGKVLDGLRPVMEKREDGQPRLANGGKKQYRLLSATDALTPAPAEAFDFSAAAEEADPFADD